MTEEWLCEQMQNLRVKENCLSTLTEIKERLKANPNLDAEVTNRLLCSPELYDCMEQDEINNTTNDKKSLEMVCDILSKCLENFSFEGNTDLHHLLQRGLMHKQSRIKALFLNALLKELDKLTADKVDENDPTTIISMELLHYILLAIQEQKTDVGGPALRILSAVLNHYLDDHTVKNTLLEALKKNDIVKCRLYELAVNIGLRSAANLEKIEFILDHALSELDNDDVLVQVNILEILVPLAESNPGLTYLEKRQVFEVLDKWIEDMEHSQLDGLIPGILMFFGKISSVQPQKVINGYPHVIGCLFQCLLSGAHSVLPTAFDALVNLTYTEHGVYLLENNYPTVVKEVFETFSVYLRNLPIALRTRALDSLTYIFTFEKEEVLPEISSILQRWFNYLNNGLNNMHFLMLSSRIPFADLRYSTLNLVRSVCYYPWGIQALKNTAGFLEFLLDRTIEFDDAAKYVKFGIIGLLANSGAFDPQTNLQLETYVNEGPYFVRSIVEVAVEGNE